MDMTQKFLEQPKVGTLKLSEAIREGIRMRPNKCLGVLFARGASCAVGAAWEGLGNSVGDVLQVDAENGVYSALSRKYGNDIIAETWKRNDGVENKPSMTREQIADWLAAQGY